MFKSFIKYYDPEIFVAAGRRIRTTVLSADELSPTERVKKIAQLFDCFKNPDKETVLTPWRVVNMHMSDCLGGYDFYDEAHEQMVDDPRFVNRGKVTADTFANAGARVLECACGPCIGMVCLPCMGPIAFSAAGALPVLKKNWTIQNCSSFGMQPCGTMYL